MDSAPINRVNVIVQYLYSNYQRSTTKPKFFYFNIFSTCRCHEDRINEQLVFAKNHSFPFAHRAPNCYFKTAHQTYLYGKLSRFEKFSIIKFDSLTFTSAFHSRSPTYSHTIAECYQESFWKQRIWWNENIFYREIVFIQGNNETAIQSGQRNWQCIEIALHLLLFLLMNSPVRFQYWHWL